MSIWCVADSERNMTGYEEKKGNRRLKQGKRNAERKEMMGDIDEDKSREPEGNEGGTSMRNKMMRTGKGRTRKRRGRYARRRKKWNKTVDWGCRTVKEKDGREQKKKREKYILWERKKENRRKAKKIRRGRKQKRLWKKKKDKNKKGLVR